MSKSYKADELVVIPKEVLVDRIKENKELLDYYVNENKQPDSAYLYASIITELEEVLNESKLLSPLLSDVWEDGAMTQRNNQDIVMGELCETIKTDAKSFDKDREQYLNTKTFEI